MEPEIELELFAALCADVEAGRPLVDVLRAEGLSESRWNQSRDVWMGRMSYGPENERKMFEERYLTAFHTRKRVTVGRNVTSPGPESIAPNSAEIEDPPTHRAPMGTVIQFGSPQAESAAELTRASAPKDPPQSATPPMGVIVPTPPDPGPEKTAMSREYTPPMGVAAPNLADIPPPRPLPNPEHTPPMGVRTPSQVDLAPPRSLPSPEHTPPMGVRVPNPSDLSPSRPLPSSEHTPPMGVAAPNLTELLPPRPLPSPEHTPPMGVAAPNLADLPRPRPLPNTEHTPPMGVAAPNLTDVAAQRPRRTPEPTPPMRPRSDLVPDEMARYAADVVPERKTDPPQPVRSRPALPFPPPPSVGSGNLPVPLPPPSTAFRQGTGAYPAPPAPASVAQPIAFQQAAPQPQPAAAPTFGSYPSVMSLVAQASGPVPPSPSSSAGFPSPGKPQGPPLTLGGFPASASGPRCTLDVYARFAAEIAVKPVEVAEIRERYGFTDVTHTAEDEAWQRRFSSDRETYVRYAKLFQHYRDWYSGRTQR